MKFSEFINEAKVEKGSMVGKTPHEFDNAFKTWFAGAQQIMAMHYKKNFPTLTPDTLTMTEGPKYIKIIQKRAGGGPGGSLWAFIDKGTGDVLKPASANAPAKHARGNLFDAKNGLGSVGPYGPAYLR